MAEQEFTLLEKWRGTAYSNQMTKQKSDMFWGNYFNIEKGIYQQILGNPDEVVTGTVKELAERFGTDLMIMVGFLDGINDSLTTPNPIEEMTEERAEWLYTLEEWNPLIKEERRAELYKEQKRAHTVVKGEKIGRNDPCPCGSGKKYKKCCGR